MKNETATPVKKITWKQLIRTGKKRPLPNKLSDLLEAAIEDAQLILKTVKGAALNMDNWFEGERESWDEPFPQGVTCTVCLAGASMLCRLKKDGGENVDGDDFDKMCVIDQIRTGKVNVALSYLKNMGLYDCEWDDSPQIAYVASIIKHRYNENTGRAPWETYRRAIRELRKLGL